jgi:hypothetical protein
MKKLILILAVILTLAFLSCITSQEIVIEYPDNADWTFSYYDTAGIYIGDGKGELQFMEDEKKFNFIITESAFGDKATITGYIGEYNEDTGTFNFYGNGEWFLGEKFNYEGEFNAEFTSILDGSLAYSSEISPDDVKTVSEKMDSYRNELIQYQKLSEKEKENTNQPEKPQLNDELMSLVYTWEAELLKDESE